MHYAREGQAWQAVTVSGELQSYSLDGLACGSSYLLYLEAQNSVDKGPPSQRIRATTKGGGNILKLLSLNFFECCANNVFILQFPKYQMKKTWYRPIVVVWS